jgi:hypothetical protein
MKENNKSKNVLMFGSPVGEDNAMQSALPGAIVFEMLVIALIARLKFAPVARRRWIILISSLERRILQKLHTICSSLLLLLERL